MLGAAAALAANPAPPERNPVIDRGYRQMYDLNFDEAHKTFAQWERDHPGRSPRPGFQRRRIICSLNSTG